MNATTVKERIETISKDQIMQLLVQEVLGCSCTMYVEMVGATQLTKEVEPLEQFGFSILTDEESDFEDKIGCFYDDCNLDKLMDFINSKNISESEINLDNKSITITFVDNMEVYVEFV